MNYSLPKVLVQVFDFDNGSEDDFLGRTSIPVTSIMDNTDIFDRQVEVPERWLEQNPLPPPSSVLLALLTVMREKLADVPRPYISHGRTNFKDTEPSMSAFL